MPSKVGQTGQRPSLSQRGFSSFVQCSFSPHTPPLCACGHCLTHAPSLPPCLFSVTLALNNGIAASKRALTHASGRLHHELLEDVYTQIADMGVGHALNDIFPEGLLERLKSQGGGWGGGSGLQDGAMANRCVFALSCHVSHHLCVVPPLQLPLADSQQPSSPPRLRGHLRAHLWFFFPANFLWLLLVEIRESQLSSILARTNN